MKLKDFDTFSERDELEDVTGCNNCPFCKPDRDNNTYACSKTDDSWGSIDVVDENGDKLKYMPKGCPIK